METSIPVLRLAIATTDRDPGQLVRERRSAACSGTRPSRNAARETHGLEPRHKPRDAALTRVGQHQVERDRVGGEVVGRARSLFGWWSRGWLRSVCYRPGPGRNDALGLGIESGVTSRRPGS